MSIAFRYAEASQLVPLGSIQNVFNFLSEYYLLKYDFGITDFAGAAILLLAFTIPLI